MSFSFDLSKERIHVTQYNENALFKNQPPHLSNNQGGPEPGPLIGANVGITKDNQTLSPNLTLGAKVRNLFGKTVPKITPTNKSDPVREMPTSSSSLSLKERLTSKFRPSNKSLSTAVGTIPFERS